VANTMGHVSLDTTNIDAETHLEMKAKALATCEIASEPKTNRRWREDAQSMNFWRLDISYVASSWFGPPPQ
jgi:integrase/recombinase XerD